jgi:hypothetical protein
MRFLLKAVVPVEAGNRGVKDGSLGARLKQVMEELKPEAAYFYTEDGKRTSLMVIDLKDASQIPAVAEPFFLGLNAHVELHPIMGPEDLAKAGLENLAKKWG